jgi:endonuclease/exonuclease/phosphatase family metal-dependent hydrolase
MGSDHGLLSNGWPKRKFALKAQLQDKVLEIICVQEALLQQLEFIEQLFPNHKRIGVGRDDGRSRGEHCAILYDQSRLEIVRSDTFWLSHTPEDHKQTWDIFFKRICTWAHFRDRKSNVEFCIFNTHFPLRASARKKAVKLLVHKIRELSFERRTILTGDFNSAPNSNVWLTICENEFSNAEQVVNLTTGLSRTYHYKGKQLDCVDGVFVSSGIQVLEHRLLREQLNDIWPSDHFGIEVKLQL